MKIPRVKPRFWPQSFAARLILSHILVAVMTGVTVTAIMLTVIWVTVANMPPEAYQLLALNALFQWETGMPDGEPNHIEMDVAPGWSLIVDSEDQVLWGHGETTCRAGMPVAGCQPEALGITEGQHPVDRNGEAWIQLAMPLKSGYRVLLERGPFLIQPSLTIGNWVIYGYGGMMAYEIVTRGLLAIPVAFGLVWLITRPQLKRIGTIARTSQRFAAGDLGARTNDPHGDEVGLLARQFDDMAGGLEQHITALRDLAQRNAELATRAEQAAVRAERARLSRELHDAIAQRLFSLSVSTAALPELIMRDTVRGIEQTRGVAAMAEQALLDLRALLIDLRPAALDDQGLAPALQALCEETQAAYQRTVTPTILLNGGRLPVMVEETLYRIAQEALSNAARHADADLIELSLVEGQRQISLSVTDNGRGFDAAEAGGGAHFGLLTMRERAAALGGACTVESQPGCGTTVQVRLPLRVEDKSNLNRQEAKN